MKIVSKKESSIEFSDIKRWYEENVHPAVLDLNDQNVFEHVYHDGNWAGIFQCTMPAAQRFFQRGKPKSVTDLAALTSIYRPGPLAAKVDDIYLKAKADPDAIVYEHPLIKQVLESTYGTLIFQEQIMALGNVVGGMTLDECDKMRKVITKRSMSGKDDAKKETEKLKEKFIDGAAERGLDRGKAAQLFEKIAYFSGYGFNKTINSRQNIYILRDSCKILVRLEDVVPGDFVLSRDEKSGKNIWVRVLAKHDHGVLELVEVELEDGQKVRCTLDHKFRVEDGRMLPLWKIIEDDLSIVVVDTETTPKVKSIKQVGAHQTYDLEVDHPDHQFYLANGMLTSNSHAVSYAIESYQCAWLLTYFEPEWLCAYIESQSGKPESRSSAIKELKSFGYEIAQIDINYAETGWTIMENKRFMPSFKSVKTVGDAAIEEIVRYRPYKTLETFLWFDNSLWKHSKFNKRALESLIKIGAFDSMDIVGPGKLFENYRQMHWVLVENNQALKHKKTGIESLKRLIQESRSIEDWSRMEKIRARADLLGNLDLDILVPEKLQKKLVGKGIVSVDECGDAGGICWFIVNQATIRQSKNGKSYLLLVVSAGGTQTHRVYCWSWNGSDIPGQFDIFLGELSRTQFGFSTNSAKIRKFNLDEDVKQ